MTTAQPNFANLRVAALESRNAAEIARLIEKFGKDIQITTLFQFPTIASLAGHLGNASKAEANAKRVRHGRRAPAGSSAVPGFVAR